MATTYETIYQYVQDDLHRPDLEGEIKRRIQRVVQQLHRQEQWKRDLIEQIYVFENSESIIAQNVAQGVDTLYLQTVQASSRLYVQEVKIKLLTRPRFFLYFKKFITQNSWGTSVVDPVTGSVGTTAGGDIEEASPDSMTDAYGYNRTDTYYRSGEMIKINSSTPLSQIYIGYFSDPIVDPVESLNDWISTDFPSLVATEVIWRLFGRIGKDSEKKMTESDLIGERATLYANNIRVTGK